MPTKEMIPPPPLNCPPRCAPTSLSIKKCGKKEKFSGNLTSESKVGTNTDTIWDMTSATTPSHPGMKLKQTV
jgi:hypothetical protein